MARDDFTADTKRVLSERVASRCSNPECLAVTAGPQVDPTKALNVGVAAHITAASPGGPRYDATSTPEMRVSIDNGIWLCQTCAKLVDNDPTRFAPSVLRQWKLGSEATALTVIGKTTPAPVRHPVQVAIEANPTVVWSVRAYDRTISDPMIHESGLRQHADCRVHEITPFYVRLVDIGSGSLYTVPLGDITISYDDIRHRPMMQLRASR